MIFIINKKIDIDNKLGDLFPHREGPFVLLQKDYTYQEDINLVSFEGGDYNIGDNYFDYWNFISI